MTVKPTSRQQMIYFEHGLGLNFEGKNRIIAANLHDK